MTTTTSATTKRLPNSCWKMCWQKKMWKNISRDWIPIRIVQSAVGERWPTAKQLKWSTEWTTVESNSNRQAKPNYVAICSPPPPFLRKRAPTKFQSSATFLACHSSFPSFHVARCLAGALLMSIWERVLYCLSLPHIFALPFGNCVCLISSCQAHVNSID